MAIYLSGAKDGYFDLIQSISDLINHTIKWKTVRRAWKRGQIFPTFENNEERNKYRPLVILPAHSKVLKKCLCSQLSDHFKPLLSKIVVPCQLEQSLRGHCFEMGLNGASTSAIYLTKWVAHPLLIWQCRDVLSGYCFLWSLVGSLSFLCVFDFPSLSQIYPWMFGVQNEFSYAIVSR